MILLEQIEQQFKQETGIPTDMSVFPIVELHTQLESKYRTSHGEVFTPLCLVDRMVKQCDPKPDQYNMDLCAGQGQFTIRILRYMYNKEPFDIELYLQKFHWFNEINIENVKTLIRIFGKNINVAVGDATKLDLIPDGPDGKWESGIWKFDGKCWKRYGPEKKEPETQICPVKTADVGSVIIRAPSRVTAGTRTAPLF